MARKQRGALDDAYSKLIINDFSGGLNLNKGALALNVNESPAMLNVVPFPGRLQYRGGWTIYANLSAATDHAYDFYDQDGEKHFVSWNDGNVYDVVSGAEVSVEAAAYTAGERVGAVALNGILYWSTQTVPLRYWDPAAGTTGAVAQTGATAPPRSPYLFLYTNAIVALGVDYTGTDWQPTVMGWSAINDPGDWDASNSQLVGPLSTVARLEFGIVFGIAETGVAPFRTFIVGRSDEGVYSYTGALGSLTEALINVPTGCADGASAQYMPSADKFGMIIFLGTDGQFYVTNGITAVPVSINVLPLLSNQYTLSFANGASPRFYSGYNEQKQYYFCNVNDYQFVYKWDTGAWSLFQGWPVGPTLIAPDANGVPSLFVSSVQDPYVFAQIGIDQTFDNMSPPSVYYETPDLHMGDPNRMKEYNWAGLFTYETDTQYELTAESMANCDGTQYETTPLYFPPGDLPPEQSGIFRLAISLLGGSDVLGGGSSPSVVGTGAPVVCAGRLSVPVEGEGMLAGMANLTQPLFGGAARVRVAYNGGVMDYELLAIEVRYLQRGYLRTGNTGTNPESGIPTAFDPYIPSTES